MEDPSEHAQWLARLDRVAMMFRMSSERAVERAADQPVARPRRGSRPPTPPTEP